MCSDSHLCILKRRIVFNALTALQNLLFEVTVKGLLLESLLKKNLVDAFLFLQSGHFQGLHF